jgi:nucleotide-binding universal stress UspA family protein
MKTKKKTGEIYTMHKILVPVDGSPNAMKALQYAVFIAEKIDGEIMLLNVQPSFQTRNVKRFFSAAEIAEYQREMSDLDLSEAVSYMKRTCVPFTSKMRIGVPGEQICREAQECGAASIVMGYRGLSTVKSLVLGSVSYYVVHHAPCPVTIVP